MERNFEISFSDGYTTSSKVSVFLLNKLVLISKITDVDKFHAYIYTNPSTTIAIVEGDTFTNLFEADRVYPISQITCYKKRKVIHVKPSAFIRRLNEALRKVKG